MKRCNLIILMFTFVFSLSGCIHDQTAPASIYEYLTDCNTTPSSIQLDHDGTYTMEFADMITYGDVMKLLEYRFKKRAISTEYIYPNRKHGQVDRWEFDANIVELHQDSLNRISLIVIPLQ